MPKTGAKGANKMRKVILGLGISLDSYIARENGAVEWLSICYLL